MCQIILPPQDSPHEHLPTSLSAHSLLIPIGSDPLHLAVGADVFPPLVGLVSPVGLSGPVLMHPANMRLDIGVLIVKIIHISA